MILTSKAHVAYLYLLFVIAFSVLHLGCGDEEETASSAPTTGSVELEQYDTFFEYKEERNPDIPVRAGAAITIEIQNEGKSTHNLRVAGVDNRFATTDDLVSTPNAIGPVATGRLDLKIDQAGTYGFRCDFHQTAMTGTIVVQ